MKRSEILANRRKVIEYLKNPVRQKATGRLQAVDNPNACCCLGHMCKVLKIPSIEDRGAVCFGAEGKTAYAPLELINLVGLHAPNGGTHESYSHFEYKKYNFTSLASLNDNTSITSQEIGEYLETVIEGGRDTPWKSLGEYSE